MGINIWDLRSEWVNLAEWKTIGNFKCLSFLRARIKDLEGQGHFQKGHFRLRRAPWLSKKAPRPSKKRHKGQKKRKEKGSKFKGGGGGGGLWHIFFSDLKKKIPPKSKKKKQKKKLQTAQLSLSSLPLHSMQNALQCQWHALWSASAWNYVDKWRKKKKKNINTHVSKCAMFCSFCNRKFRTFTVFLRWIRRRKLQKFPLATIVIHNWT